tara:strand:+ start:688 stop:1362 length:675 start_codon:yes stop_codon:yes gene_type:complete
MIHNTLLFLFGCLFTASMGLWAHRFSRDLLAGLAMLQVVLANLFVLKQIHLFGFNATASDLLSVGACFAVNLFHEGYGKVATQRLIKAMWVCMAFTGVISQVVLFYEPSQYDFMHKHYHALLSNSPRIFLASLVVFYISQQINLRLYRWFREAFPQQSLPMANAFSLGISQIADTALFLFAALYGIASQLLELFIISYLIKAITILLFSPFSAFVLKNERFTRE